MHVIILQNLHAICMAARAGPGRALHCMLVASKRAEKGVPRVRGQNVGIHGAATQLRIETCRAGLTCKNTHILSEPFGG